MKFLADPAALSVLHRQGGVGKTSVACATAITLAGQGKDDAAGQHRPGIQRRAGVRVDDRQAPSPTSPTLRGWRRWRSTPTRPRRPTGNASSRTGPRAAAEAELASITEQLSGHCTTGSPRSAEFTELLTGSDGRIGQYDHVLFDTAPPGTPSGFCNCPDPGRTSSTGARRRLCLGPLAGLEKQRTVYAAAVDDFADRQRTRLVLVARAQQSTLAGSPAPTANWPAIGLTHPVRGDQRSPARPGR